MDWEYVQEIIPRFVQAAQMTLKLSAWGVGGSLLLGVLVALAISYRVRVLQGLARGYVELSRNTPLLIQLFFLYYGLPKIGIHWDGFVCGVIALTFLGGSYMAEALRAGLEAVPHGQVESATAIGLTKVQVLRYVVLPQALPMMLPSFVNQWIALIKDTSLAYVIGVGELSFVATQVSNRVMVYPAEIFLAVAVLYYLMCASLDVASGRLLKRQPARAWQEPQAD